MNKILQSNSKVVVPIMEIDVKVIRLLCFVYIKQLIFYQILCEFKSVMGPVATCLDILQGEDGVFMGMLLPTLHIMKLKLEEIKTEGNLQFADKLVDSLLESFEKRFKHLYKDIRVLLAMSLHPHYSYKMLASCIAPDMSDIVRERLILEMKTMILSEVNDHDNPSSSNSKQLNELYSSDQNRLLRNVNLDRESQRREEIAEELKSMLDKWTISSANIILNQDLFPLKYRTFWIDLFLKYNTALPSSAAVERLFSVGGNILRPKRSSLQEGNFEMLVFLKGNMSNMDFVPQREDLTD